MGKIKIGNFHVVDIHLLYRTTRYTIVKVSVTKRHGIVITMWRTSAIEDRFNVVPLLQLFFVCMSVVANVPLCLDISFSDASGRLCFLTVPFLG